MGYYDEVYLKRLNRYGEDYQSRIQNQREHDFELYLLKSTERVDFEFNNKITCGVLEQYKQDETQTLKYLLTRRNLSIPGGTLLNILDTNYMVYWPEHATAQGYNRYVLLKMTHIIKWKDRRGQERQTLAYMYGQEDNMLKDELRSRSRMDTLYTENLKMSFFITPVNEYINKDDYFTISIGKMKEGYTVTGFDRLSTEGVEYVTADPVYLRDETEIPFKTYKDEDKDFFWLQGGDMSGS